VGVTRGRLAEPATAPATGEHTDELVRSGATVVSHILSGELPAPADYCQDDDEFVLVLAGAAVLEVEGRRLHLATGDWIHLPAGTAHRLVQTRPGTGWLAVHIPPA